MLSASLVRIVFKPWIFKLGDISIEVLWLKLLIIGVDCAVYFVHTLCDKAY